ncbi:MAG: ComF family protein, partial [Oscillospiraceae bacterium]
MKTTKNDVFPRLFAEKMTEDINSDSCYSKADCIVPVPMSKLKLRKRGFNQAEVLADALGEKLGIPVCSNALLKSESVVAQHKLSANRRKTNATRL